MIRVGLATRFVLRALRQSRGNFQRLGRPAANPAGNGFVVLQTPGFRLEKNRIAPIGASFDIANLPTTMEVDGYECFAQ
jgi:hypothetical protein